MRIRNLTGLLCGLLLAACIADLPAPQPQQRYTLGQRLLDEGFSTQGDWDRYDLQGVQMRAEDGAYRIQVDLEDRYAWGLNRQRHQDVVIEAEAYLRSDYPRAIYGVMCRGTAQANGRGYAFLISANGSYSIRASTGRSLEPLVKWQPSGAIQQGSRRNVIRAVCMGEYLALYINGEFVADTTDDLFRSGYSGLVAGISGAGEVDVTFDQLSAWEARPGQAE